MAKKVLMGASFLALLAAFPAFAQNVNASADVKTEATIGDKVDNALTKVENTVSRTTAKAKEATKETYSDVKAYFSDDNDVGAMTTLNVNSKVTAKHLMGASVTDAQGKSYGKVDDVLVNNEGDVERLIIKDAQAFNLGGSLVSVDHDDLDEVKADGKMTVKLSAEDIKSAEKFDYKANASDGLFRVSKIIGSSVTDVSGKKVARVEDVAFNGDDADYAIVGFDKILGMGGEKAALDFEALDLVNNQGKYAFKLNQQQSAQFGNYKQTTKTN